MENKEINICINIKKQLENLSQDQYILLFNMLNDKEKSSFCITPEVKEYINNLINKYYENERIEQLSLYEYILFKMKEKKENG